jgi:branched-chain amino acid transport system permease protein
MSGIATLALITIGLAIVFGMMRVINLAHGEFLMLGAYTAITATSFGINIFISILVIAPIVVGVIGLFVEWFVIRYLYGRLVYTMLATWGLSLLFIGLVTTIFGNTTAGISSPLGPISIGAVNVSGYKLFIIGVTVTVFVLLVILFKKTPFGLIARATMQNPDMAAAVGVDPKKTYAFTFALGAGLAGLAGGVIAPVTGIVPTIGESFVAKAFITVISGGSSVVTGTVSASTVFGAINQIGSFLTTPVFGEVAMLLAAVLLVRAMPKGITGRFFKGSI